MSTLGRIDEILRELGRELEPHPIEFENALDEMGPNHLTEFADSLAATLDDQAACRLDRGFSMITESLGRFREALVDFLQARRHAFAGGVAVRTYRARVGPTEDYDFLIDPVHMPEFMDFMEKQGAILQGTSDDTFFFSLKYDTHAFHVDVMEARSPLCKEALDAATPVSYQGRRLRLVTADHLAAMKVKAYQERRDAVKRRTDRADVLGLLATGKGTADKVRDILNRRRPDLLPVLEEILGGAGTDRP